MNEGEWRVQEAEAQQVNEDEKEQREQPLGGLGEGILSEMTSLTIRLCAA